MADIEACGAVTPAGPCALPSGHPAEWGGRELAHTTDVEHVISHDGAEADIAVGPAMGRVVVHRYVPDDVDRVHVVSDTEICWCGPETIAVAGHG